VAESLRFTSNDKETGWLHWRVELSIGERRIAVIDSEDRILNRECPPTVAVPINVATTNELQYLSARYINETVMPLWLRINYLYHAICICKSHNRPADTKELNERGGSEVRRVNTTIVAVAQRRDKVEQKEKCWAILGTCLILIAEYLPIRNSHNSPC